MSTSKVVIVQYSFEEAFKVPKGMDLEDKTQVKEWWVKWNILKIRLVDGTLLEIDPEYGVNNCTKHPNEEPTIEDATDYGFESEEEEFDCENGNRCDECTYCVRTRPCECGSCEVVGGTCEEQMKIYEEEVINADVCEKCHLIECCCEAVRLQVIADDKRATDEGYKEIDGRWRKI